MNSGEGGSQGTPPLYETLHGPLQLQLHLPRQLLIVAVLVQVCTCVCVRHACVRYNQANQFIIQLTENGSVSWPAWLESRSISWHGQKVGLHVRWTAY